MGPVHGFVHQSKGPVSHVTSSNPRGIARGARGPVDVLRGKGNFGNLKQTSNSGVKISPITFEIALP